MRPGANLTLWQPVERRHTQDARRPERQRPGLVEQNAVRPPETLDHAGALYDDAAPRRPGDAGGERDRCREDQRTWCRDNDNSQSTDGVPARTPRDRRQRQRGRKQQRGIAVGEPRERRALVPGLLHEAHERRIGRRRRGAGRPAPLRTAAPATLVTGSDSPVSVASSTTA
jgi:hypothetical protein